jgi:hypothetical protein
VSRAPLNKALALQQIMWRFGKRPQPKSPDTEAIPNLVCSFCGKNQGEVRKLIAGPKVYICDECVDLCNDIIAEECDHEANLTGSETVPERPVDQVGLNDEADQNARVPVWPLSCAICSKSRNITDLLYLPAGVRLCVVCLDAIEKLIEASKDDDPRS